MATIQENADALAKELETALQADGFAKKAGAITEQEVRRSRTAAVLKTAEARLSQQGVSESDKTKIAETATEKIRGRRGYLRQMMKEASNDNAVALADYIDRLLGRK